MAVLYSEHCQCFLNTQNGANWNGLIVQKFRLLLASPDAGYKVFKSLQKKEHGEAEMFSGKHSLIFSVSKRVHYPPQFI